MINNPCKYKVSAKKVKCFPLKTTENVDKMEFLLISQPSKGLNTMGFRKYPAESPQEIPATHDFSSRQLQLQRPQTLESNAY